MTTSNPILSQCLDTFALSPLNIDSTCFKNLKNPSCIVLLLTNFKHSFMKTNVFETGISDHHKMIVSEIFNTHFINITKTLDLKPRSFLQINVFPKLCKLLKTIVASSLRREECQFKFYSVSGNEVRKFILNMDGKKENLTSDIPAGILKDCVDSYISVLTKILSTSL